MKEVYLISQIPVEKSDKFNGSVNIMGTRDAMFSLAAACAMCEANLNVDKFCHDLVDDVYENYRDTDKSSLIEFKDWPEDIKSGDIIVIIAGTEEVYDWTMRIKEKFGDLITIYPIYNTGGAAKDLYKDLKCPEIENTSAYISLFKDLIKNTGQNNS